MRTANCRSCGAPIVWIPTTAGKAMPCDAAPVFFREIEKGKDRVVTQDGVTVSCEIVTEPERATGRGYTPHWGTCDAPDKFRKDRK